MKKILLLLITLSTLCISCNSNSCKDLPLKFESYNQAHDLVTSTRFNFHESKSNFSSSWVDKIEFYSCDNNKGFFLYYTKKGKEYLHQDVPIKLWKDLKATNSKGRFIRSNLKGRYRLKLK